METSPRQRRSGVDETADRQSTPQAAQPKPEKPEKTQDAYRRTLKKRVGDEVLLPFTL